MNQNTNSINLQQSANAVEQQQESFLRLTQNPQHVLPASSAGVVSNGLFPSTIVGSSVSVGTQSENLPPGSAGFGTVEAVDLGSVFINPSPSPLQNSLQQQNQNSLQQQNQNSLLPNNHNLQQQSLNSIQQQNLNSLNISPNNQASIVSNNQGSFGPTLSPNLDFIPQHNPNTFNQQSQNLDVLPVYGQSDTNVNIAVIPSNQGSFSQGSFGPTFSPNDNLPTYGNRPQSDASSQSFFPSTGNALPNYGQPQSQQNTILANQYNSENFQSLLDTHAWKGANQQQQLLHNSNRLPNINSQSQLTPTFSAGPHSNERPVRFPGDANNRFDVSYENYDRGPYDNYDSSSFDQYAADASSNVYNNQGQISYYNTPQQQDYYNTPQQQNGNYNSQEQQADYQGSQEQQNYYNPSTPTPNIVAELTKYSKKNNLMHKPRSDSSGSMYISYPSSHEMEEPDKELIFYPSGQLIVGQSPNIGPNLRQHLSSQPLSYQSAASTSYQSYQHNQAPHYVFARKKPPSYEGKTELFDPMLEGDELIERSDKTTSNESEEGLLPVLIRTAKDDFKLVGDVIKMAFSKR